MCACRTPGCNNCSSIIRTACSRRSKKKIMGFRLFAVARPADFLQDRCGPGRVEGWHRTVRDGRHRLHHRADGGANLFQAESNWAVARANVSLGATAIHWPLGEGWQIRDDSNFVTAATRDEMRAQTNWRDVFPAGQPQPPAPGRPTPADIGPTVRCPRGERAHREHRPLLDAETFDWKGC